METIDEMVAKLKDSNDWETPIHQWASEQARILTRRVLEAKDHQLVLNRPLEFTVEAVRSRRILTRYGYVTISRRLYRDQQGNRHYLLDEQIGLQKRIPLTGWVEQTCLMLAGQMPFGKAERLLRWFLPDGASHTTIHRTLARLAAPGLKQEDAQVRSVFEDGEVPHEVGTKEANVLFVEADGVSIALQREQERRTEVKVGIAYEGWESAGSRGRYTTKDKTVYMSVGSQERFWEGFALELARKYEPGGVGCLVRGGDGAHWVREGGSLLGGMYQLDRFHLRRELLRRLQGDAGLAGAVYAACTRGEVGLADSLLIREQGRSSVERAKDIGKLRSYLMLNAEGLKDYRLEVKGDGLRGLGAIEGNNDKLVAWRMKRRGMSWSKKGAGNMVRLLLMQYQGRLEEMVGRRAKKVDRVPEATAHEEAHEEAKVVRRRSESWAPEDRVGMPVLYGPASSRPWVCLIRNMAHGTS